MITFKCQCGKAILAFEANIGQAVQCPYCQNTPVVPPENADDCLQVFREGDREQGCAMTLEELQTALQNGSVSVYDLGYHCGFWRPIYDIFQLPHAPSSQEQLKNAEPDIAVKFSELEPIISKPSVISAFSSPTKPQRKRTGKLVIALIILLIAYCAADYFILGKHLPTSALLDILLSPSSPK